MDKVLRVIQRRVVAVSRQSCRQLLQVFLRLQQDHGAAYKKVRCRESLKQTQKVRCAHTHARLRYVVLLLHSATDIRKSLSSPRLHKYRARASSQANGYLLQNRTD